MELLVKNKFIRIVSITVISLGLSSCGLNDEAKIKALNKKVNTLKKEACDAWTAGVKVGGSIKFVDYVIMPEAAAEKFTLLANARSSYTYASKAAYTLTMFNGQNLGNVNASLKPMLLAALTDIKRTCGD